MRIGSNLSLSGGLTNTIKGSLNIGANAVMVYTRSPQQFHYSPMSRYSPDEGKEFAKEHNFDLGNIVIHAPYIVNPSSPDEDKRENAVRTISTEIDRASSLGAKYVVIHPGSSTGTSRSNAVANLADSLNRIIENTKDYDVIICLETMAGKGSEMGTDFSELSKIIDLVDNKDRIGVCWDTCHLHDFGYDIVNNLDIIIRRFDKLIGLDKLYVVHVNGSFNYRGARKDRHALISAEDNLIGLEPLLRLCNEPRIKDNAILILETGNVDTFKFEIDLIKNYKKLI